MSLKKIAEMTGVSMSTVSRVLNNKEYNCASNEVKDKIWAAAKELNYVPNESARNLQKGNVRQPAAKRSLAVILGRFNTLETDPFFGELFRSVEQEVFAKGCVIEKIITAQEFIQGQLPEVDGFIILGRSSEDLLKKLKKKNKNIIAIDRNPTSFEIDEVVCDGKEAAAKAMEYLIEKGHDRIGYIGDCSYETRYIGYCDALIKNKMPMDYSYIYPTNQTEETGYQAMLELMEQNKVKAVLCANDATAIGVLRAYNELRKIKKTKIDIISIDNIKAAEEVKPLLTTVNVPEKDMGKIAVKILLDRIEKGHTEKMRIEFPSRLIKRESC